MKCISNWEDKYLPKYNGGGRIGRFSYIEDEIDAIHMSILKWKGLKKENLKKYNFRFEDMKRFMTASSCALCQYHDINCSSCILGKLKMPCEPYKLSPYHLSMKTENANYMIVALRIALVVATIKKKIKSIF